MGFIYIIKNTINDKVYIGQTINTIEERFNQHIWRSNNLDIKTKVYVAMRELGIENFYVEQLIECNEKELNKYEQYYVEKYDSLNNGYNSVYPCSSTGERPVHDYEDKVIDMYLEGYNNIEIVKQLNISITHMYKILNRHNISKKGTENGDTKYESNSLKENIIMYSKDFEPLERFRGIIEACKWVRNNIENVSERVNIGRYIDIACQNGNICYGHRWQLFSDLKYENKIFRTKFDKEAYLNGLPAYQPDGMSCYVVDGALDSVKTYHKENKCIDCGKKIEYRSKRCLECNKKHQKVLDSNLENALYTCSQCGRQVNQLFNGSSLCNSCYNVQAKGKSPKPSKEELEYLLKQGLQKKQIAELYRRSPGAIQYWIDSYGLSEYKHNKEEKNKVENTKPKRVQKQPDVSGVTCVELNIHFKSFKEAAEYLVNNKYTNRSHIKHIGYSISKAKQSKERFCGLTWI